MTQYKVINDFKEVNHDNHIYVAGDSYPVEGKKFVKSRGDFLTKVHPEYGKSFLQEIEVKRPFQKKNEGDAK